MQETYVVMEWCEKGSLQSAVADGVFHVHGSEWGHDAIMPIISATLLDISIGMAYLHRMHILHCDLKLRNVLLKLAQVQLFYWLLASNLCAKWYTRFQMDLTSTGILEQTITTDHTVLPMYALDLSTPPAYRQGNQACCCRMTWVAQCCETQCIAGMYCLHCWWSEVATPCRMIGEDLLLRCLILASAGCCQRAICSSKTNWPKMTLLALSHTWHPSCSQTAQCQLLQMFTPLGF